MTSSRKPMEPKVLLALSSSFEASFFLLCSLFCSMCRFWPGCFPGSASAAMPDWALLWWLDRLHLLHSNCSWEPHPHWSPPLSPNSPPPRPCLLADSSMCESLDSLSGFFFLSLSLRARMEIMKRLSSSGAHWLMHRHPFWHRGREALDKTISSGGLKDTPRPRRLIWRSTSRLNLLMSTMEEQICKAEPLESRRTPGAAAARGGEQC